MLTSVLEPLTSAMDACDDLTQRHISIEPLRKFKSMPNIKSTTDKDHSIKIDMSPNAEIPLGTSDGSGYVSITKQLDHGQFRLVDNEKSTWDGNKNGIKLEILKKNLTDRDLLK